MGREKDAKGNGKAKNKETKLKRLSDHERAGAGGDAHHKSTKRSKSAEKADHGKSKKVKTPKKETPEPAVSHSEQLRLSSPAK